MKSLKPKPGIQGVDVRAGKDSPPDPYASTNSGRKHLNHVERDFRGLYRQLVEKKQTFDLHITGSLKELFYGNDYHLKFPTASFDKDGAKFARACRAVNSCGNRLVKLNGGTGPLIDMRGIRKEWKLPGLPENIGASARRKFLIDSVPMGHAQGCFRERLGEEVLEWSSGQWTTLANEEEFQDLECIGVEDGLGLPVIRLADLLLSKDLGAFLRKNLSLKPRYSKGSLLPEIVKGDIRSCYWNFAYALGFIDGTTWEKHGQDKDCRNKAIGNTRKKTHVYHFDNGQCTTTLTKPGALSFIGDAVAKASYCVFDHLKAGEGKRGGYKVLEFETDAFTLEI
jgi:hypothetical protein